MITTQLRAYEVEGFGRKLVPVEIPGHTGNCPVTAWNMRCRRWHKGNPA